MQSDEWLWPFELKNGHGKMRLTFTIHFRSTYIGQDDDLD